MREDGIEAVAIVTPKQESELEHKYKEKLEHHENAPAEAAPAE